MTGVDPVLLEDQLHFDLAQMHSRKRLAGDPLDALGGTKVDAAADEHFPLSRIATRAYDAFRCRHFRFLSGVLFDCGPLNTHQSATSIRLLYVCYPLPPAKA